MLGNHTTDLQESPKLSRAELKAHSIRPYDEKVDVWAAGILAYECVVASRHLKSMMRWARQAFCLM